MTLPFGTRYVYFAVACVFVLSGVLALTRTSRGQEILTDLREELNLELSVPPAPDQPDLDAKIPKPSQNKLTVTRRPGQFTGDQLLVLQNPTLAAADTVILAKDETKSFPTSPGARVTAKGDWQVVSRVPATIPEGNNLLWQPESETEFIGVFEYQNPFSGATYTLATDDRPAYLLGYDSSFDSTGERFRYLWVSSDQVTAGSSEDGVVLRTPEIQMRTLNLLENTYADESLTLPTEVTTTRRSYTIFRDQITFANLEIASDVFETYDLASGEVGTTTILFNSYQTNGGRVKRGEEELGSIQLRPELRLNSYFDQPTPETLLLSTSENGPGPSTNILLFDLKTREFSIALENNYEEYGRAGRSQYALSQIQALTRGNIYTPTREASSQTTVRLNEYDLSSGEDEFSARLQAENPELYASLLAQIRRDTHSIPPAWSASSVAVYPASAGFSAPTPPLRVKTTHYLQDLFLEVIPKDGLVPGAYSQFQDSFDLLGRVLATDTVPTYQAGEGNLFVAFNPLVYEGGAVHVGGIGDKLETDEYTTALLTAEAQCYGGCAYRWVVLLEDETSYQRIASRDLGDETSRRFMACEGSEACLQGKFNTDPSAQTVREEFLNRLRQTEIIR